MIEIKILGRGGQGGKKLSKMIAQAAFNEGKQVQSFALYGAERRGAPVFSFVRVDVKPIELRGYVTDPDFTVVLDDSLLEMVNDDGVVIVNSNKYDFGGFITSIDATSIALETMGQPIFNTTMLGAFAKVTGLINIESATEAIQSEFAKLPQKIIDKNIKACVTAYEAL